MTPSIGTPLNRHSRQAPGRPLWAQVKSSLIRMIIDDKLGDHARLPSEQALCAQFGVSRTVVREALNRLVVERKIYKLQGKGAFVASQREEQSFFSTTTMGFSGDFSGRDNAVARRVLEQRTLQPGERVRKMLRLAEGENATQLSRVLIVDGVPRMVVHSFFPAALVPGLDQMPFESRSLYDTLGKQYGIVMHHADRWIEAALPSAEEAILLGIAVDTPLLAIESLAWSKAGDPIEFYYGVYCSAQARVHIRVESR